MRKMFSDMPITRKKKEILLFLERIMAVVLAVSITFVFINSFLNISTSYGTTYHYVVHHGIGSVLLRRKRYFIHC